MSEGVRPAREHEWSKLTLTRPPTDARFTPDTSSQDTDETWAPYGVATEAVDRLEALLPPEDP